MKKKFKLPTKSAIENTVSNPTPAETGENQNLMPAAFPLDRVNHRDAFVEQAKQLKEKLVIGATPERVEHPKNNTSLDKEGFLKGDVETQKEGKETATIDLVDRAKSVTESAKDTASKRWVCMFEDKEIGTVYADTEEEAYKKMVETFPDYPYGKYDGVAYVFEDGEAIAEEACATEEMTEAELEMAITDLESQWDYADDHNNHAEAVRISDEIERLRAMKDKVQKSSGVIKDERESTDSQPKEAVACEARGFNKREQRLLQSGNPEEVREMMASGQLSRLRGHKILHAMGESSSAGEDVVFSKATDAGTPIPTPDTDVIIDDGSFETEDGRIDKYIAQNLPCRKVWKNKTSRTGSLEGMAISDAKTAKSILESWGYNAAVQVSANEGVVVFSKEEALPTENWYAIVVDKANPNKLNQITLSATIGATYDEVFNFVAETYGKDLVKSVSKTQLSRG